LTTEIDDIQRPPGEPEPSTPKLVVIPGGFVPTASETPPPDGLFSPPPAEEDEPADADLFRNEEDEEDEEDEPTPLPEVSLLSVYPPVRAFFWAFLYAVLSAVVTMWASWDASFRAACLINGYSLHEWDAPLRLFTSMLMHSGLDHYLGNMILLVPFAGFTTAYYSFWAFPVILVTLGIGTHLITIWSYPLYLNLVGSSGLLYVVFGFWLVLYAWVESHLRFTKRVLRLAGFSLMMLIPHTYSPTTSYRAHYIGLGLGVVAGLFYIIVRRGPLRARTLSAQLAEQEARRSRPAYRRYIRRRG